MELSRETLQDLCRRYAKVLADFGAELGEQPLVLPNGDFFPDRFSRDAASVQRLVTRMQEHAGMLDIPITAELVSLETEGTAGGSCSSGACHTPAEAPQIPRVVDRGSEWRIHVPAPELGSPVVMTAQLARALGVIFLAETEQPGRTLAQPLEVTAELGAVALGFGVLLIEGSHIYVKSCGGPQIGRVTALGCDELAVALALFVRARRQSPRLAAKELSPTQEEAFTRALEWVDDRPALIQQLQRSPQQVAEQPFAFDEPKKRSLFSRLFPQKRRDEAQEPPLAELEQMVTQAKRKQAKRESPEDEELRRIVREALEEQETSAPR